MSFTAAVADQRFVLEHVVKIDELANTDRFAAASADVVDAVLEGVASFAAGEWAPLNREGDTVGANGPPTASICRPISSRRIRITSRAAGARSACRRISAARACPSRSRPRARYVGQRQHGLRALPDAHRRRDRGADPPRHPRPAGAISAPPRHRRLDGHDEPHRTAGGQRRRRAAFDRQAAG